MTDPPGASLIRETLGSLEWSEMELPPQLPVMADLPPGLSLRLREALAAQGIQQLFEHQAQAAASLLLGQDTILVTGTSSGKTLAYCLPVFESLAREPMARALLVYPTKALAQDQLGKLRALAGENGPTAAVYDGDTPKSQRSAIRAHAQIILTNPDMLHLGILPSHELWRPFLRSLRHLVLDEAHTLRGVFGSHAAWVIRRLLRLCSWHGAQPVIAAASATVPNPGEFFRRLTGREAVVVAQDSSPKASRSLFLVDLPEGLDEDAPSPNTVSARLLASLACEGVRALVFCRSRATTELIVRHARELLIRQGGDPSWLDSYRGGYTASERRSIEQAFFRGRLRGLAATNAMELGVDVGGLDAVILNGYPGSLASFWQMAGRTGRSGRPGSVVYIPHEDALELHILRRPEILFSGIEPVVVSPGNPVIASGQLQCAAFERPLSDDEPDQMWPESSREARALVESGQMAVAAGRFFFAGHHSPAAEISIRGASLQNVQLVCQGQEVGEMEDWRALQYAHPGAVYLHRDMAYVVDRLDWPARTAFLRPISPDHYTVPLVQTVAEEKARVKETVRQGAGLALSVLEITSRTSGFRRVSLHGGRLLDEEELEMPVLTFSTVGAVVDVSSAELSILDERTPGIVHGVEHLLAATAPLVAGCDPRDLMSFWSVVAPETLAPRVIVFDAMPGGIGLSEALVGSSAAWIRLAREVAESCPCEEGCPRCLLSSRCGTGNKPLDKKGAIACLHLLESAFKAF